MYDSLEDIGDDFTLYVIAFDDNCYEALCTLALPHMAVISYGEFEDDTLRKARNNRTKREFIWTCSGYSIRYIMKRFDLSDLTYIDSDLYFFESPRNTLQSFLDNNCDAAIIPHNYSKNPENTYTEKQCGKYCVEFNSFKNTPNGMAILDWWIDKCIESCPETPQNGKFGDQKYLDEFDKLFDGIYVYEDFGMGIAPWNVDDYVVSSQRASSNAEVAMDTDEICDISIRNRHTGETGPIVFYHFHSIDVFPDGSSNIRVFIRPGQHDSNLVKSLYRPYIRKILAKRMLLNERFGMFAPSTQPENHKLQEGELRSFLTGEPNLIFLIRKLWRYILHKQKDYIKV